MAARGIRRHRQRHHRPLRICFVVRYARRCDYRLRRRYRRMEGRSSKSRGRRRVFIFRAEHSNCGRGFCPIRFRQGEQSDRREGKRTGKLRRRTAQCQDRRQTVCLRGRFPERRHHLQERGVIQCDPQDEHHDPAGPERLQSRECHGIPTQRRRIACRHHRIFRQLYHQDPSLPRWQGGFRHGRHVRQQGWPFRHDGLEVHLFRFDRKSG